MSRGLGKWERNIMNIVTYPNIFPWVNLREIIQILLDCDNPFFPEVNNKTVNERIEFFLIHDGAFLEVWFSIQEGIAHDNEGKVFYQNIMRAIRSLEKKGFIKSRLEPLDFKEDNPSAKPTKEITFNPKCLTNGIPWQLKYLNKRLTKIKRGEYA